MEVGFLENEVLLSVPTTGDIRTTKSELTFYSEIVKPQLIVVPIDFKTDLGSIPVVIQPFIPKDGLALFAYILHDYLYATGLFTRDECDEILKEAMQSLDVKSWRVFSVRKGLKVGGWYAWNKHRKKGNK